jgi:hypothetical protein
MKVCVGAAIGVGDKGVAKIGADIAGGCPWGAAIGPKILIDATGIPGGCTGTGIARVKIGGMVR